MFVTNNAAWTKERRLAFFLHLFCTNIVSLEYESLEVPTLMPNDVCRNIKTQKQVNGSMDLCYTE